MRLRLFDLFPWLAIIGIMLIVIVIVIVIVIGGVGSIWQMAQ